RRRQQRTIEVYRRICTSPTVLFYLLLLQKFWQLMQSEASAWGNVVYMAPPYSIRTKTSITLSDNYSTAAGGNSTVLTAHTNSVEMSDKVLSCVMNLFI